MAAAFCQGMRHAAGLLLVSSLFLLSHAGCSAQLGAGLSGVAAAAPTRAATPRPAAPPPAQQGVPAQGAAVQGEAAARVSIDVEISFYGIPLRGANDLVFVLDRSGSMSGRKIDHAKEELLSVIDALPDGTRIGLIFFNSRLRTLSRADFVGRSTSNAVKGGGGGWLASTVSGAATHVAVKASGRDSDLTALDAVTRPAVRSFIKGIRASGSTAAVPAMRRAYQMGARHVVFLSDGLANNGGSPEQLLAEAEGRARDGVRIDTVGLGGDQDAAVMQGMANASGGTAVTY